MKSTTKNIIIFTIVIIAGLIAGFSGNLLARYSESKLPFFTDLVVPTQGQVGQREVVIQEAKKVIVEQDVRVGQVLDQTQKTLYGVYKKRAVGKSILEQLYAPSDFVAGAVAVTSDGWLISRIDGNPSSSSLVIIKDESVMPIEKIIADPATGLKFIKVESANLSVAEFAATESISLGQSVLAYDIIRHAAHLTSIKDLRFQNLQTRGDYLFSADQYNERLRLNDSSGTEFTSVPIFNLNGEIVGLSEAGDTAIKMNYINFLLKSVLRDGKIQKPYFGFSYVDLDAAQGLPSIYPSAGALVVKNSLGVVVARDSSLFNQLNEGDIITAIENNSLNSEHSLLDLLYDYKMGSTITLKVLRGKDTLEVKYTLEAKK